MTGGIEVIRSGAQIVLRISNAAKRNSVDLPMLHALRQAALDIAQDDSVQIVVLRGAGNKAFCAGADFDAVTAPPIAQSVAALDTALHEAVTALLSIPVPLIAAIEGACFGGGVQLALCADFRIANETARFGIPAAQIGMAYPLAAIARIVRFAGAGAANKMLLTGEPFSAQDALRHRLIDEVVAEDMPSAEMRDTAATTIPASAVTPAVSTMPAPGTAADSIPEASQCESRFDRRLRSLSKMITAYDRAAAIAYKAMIQALANDDAKRAQLAHARLADAALYLPKLQAILAERANGKSAQAEGPNSAAATVSASAVSTAAAQPHARPDTGSTARSNAESSAESNAEPIAEPIAEPNAEPNADSNADSIAQSNANSTAQPTMPPAGPARS